MIKPRLILVPQMQVKMRYQEWWPQEIVNNLVGPGKPFGSCRILGQNVKWTAQKGAFSSWDRSVRFELSQMKNYLETQISESDVLLHCDLSFPGLFHQLLLRKRPGRCVAFCHATSMNNYDFWKDVSDSKFLLETGSAGIYDEVLVATRYHQHKLGWENTRVLGALPNPPARICPSEQEEDRQVLMASTARKSSQKVTMEVEQEVGVITGSSIISGSFDTWEQYYGFLANSKFLIVTSKEETYGYQVIDAVLQGCIPIAPNAYSYPELLPPELLYDNTQSSRQQAEQIVEIMRWARKNNIRPKLRNEHDIEQFWKNLANALVG